MFLSLLAALGMAGTLPEAAEPSSYLFKMETGPDHAIRLQGERYRPRSGDLILFDHHIKLITNLYRYCGTTNPVHVGIIFYRRDGSPAILEAGPEAAQKVFIFDVDDRLHKYDGTILIRRLKTPLSAEQDKNLCEFSMEQEGKKYALGRLLLQLTPFRPQGTLRGQLFGRTVLDRDRWLCSELAVAAMAVAGVIDPKAYPANAMYPRDLTYDERHDLSPFYDEPALWYAREQLEHVGDGVRVLNGK